MKIVNVNSIDLIEEKDMVVKAARNNGWQFEPESFIKWLEFCDSKRYRRPAHVYDIGAYTGIYSIAASRSGAFVLAFEPNPVVRERLELNMKLNNCAKIGVSACGVSSHRSTSRLALKPSTPLTSAGRLVGPKNEALDVIEVDLVALDDNPIPVDAMKIDVEGHEMDVLLGAIETIEKYKPSLIIEVLSEKNRKQVIDFLSKFGYPEPEFLDDRNLVFDTRG